MFCKSKVQTSLPGCQLDLGPRKHRLIRQKVEFRRRLWNLLQRRARFFQFRSWWNETENNWLVSFSRRALGERKVAGVPSGVDVKQREMHNAAVCRRSNSVMRIVGPCSPTSSKLFCVKNRRRRKNWFSLQPLVADFNSAHQNWWLIVLKRSVLGKFPFYLLQPEVAEYDPQSFIRCHFGGSKRFDDNDPRDKETVVWSCLFEPDPHKEGELTDSVSICLM